MAEKIFETEADKRERELDEKLKTLASAGNWAGVLEALDHFEKNNDRRHDSHRDDAGLSRLEGDPDDAVYYRLAKGVEFHLPGGMNYFLADDWDDVIFSKAPEDLHQLVTDPDLSEALDKLTMKQKEVLLDNIVYGIPVKDLARRACCSERNVTKLRQTALEKVRKAVAASSDHDAGKKTPKPRGCGLG